MSAKDKASGKSKDISIKAGSGLTEAEIQKMVSEAQDHAQEDRQLVALVAARNKTEGVLNEARKAANPSLDLGESIERAEQAIAGDDIGRIEAAQAALTSAMDSQASTANHDEAERQAA